MFKSIESLPVCIVEDQLDEIYIDQLVLKSLESGREDWQSRQVLTYSSLTEALDLLEWDRPFLLILDHNMEAGVDPGLAERLGANPEAFLFGYHLSKAIRQQCKLGLVVPIVYLTAALPSVAKDPGKPDFIKLLMSDGPFLPDFWQDKHDYLTRKKKWSDLIEAMDSFYEMKLAQVQEVAARVVWDSLELVGDDTPEGSEGDADA